MVKIYIADVTPLKEEKLYRNLYSAMDAGRCTKADRFLFAKDKRLCIGAGALLRFALQEEKVSYFSFAEHPNGKPYLMGKEKLYFNLSHSEEVVMCAVSDREVGCDVEKKTGFDYELAAFVMTEKDLKLIYQHEEEKKREDVFFRLWTLKESYMKATGLGILLEPKSFGMEFCEEGIRAVPSVDQRSFHFKEYVRNDGYCYSCCSLSEDFPDTMTEVDFRRISFPLL